MNTSFSISSGSPRRAAACRLALVAVLGVCAATASMSTRAAETTGRVFGQAPAGSIVQVNSPEYGLLRTIPVNAKGRYVAGWLPIGVYTVTVVDNGEPLVRHPSVQIFVDRGSRVDFSCTSGRCSELAAD